MTLVNWISVIAAFLLVLIFAVFRIGKWCGEVNSDRKIFKEFMEEIRRDIKDILNRLSPPPTTTESPIRLSELGEQISKNVGAKAWAAEVAQELVDQTKGMNPFEVQTLSFEHAKSFEPGDELLAKMQQSAYESGLDLEGVERVLGVELRDHLLQLNNLS